MVVSILAHGSGGGRSPVRRAARTTKLADLTLDSCLVHKTRRGKQRPSKTQPGVVEPYPYLACRDLSLAGGVALTSNHVDPAALMIAVVVVAAGPLLTKGNWAYLSTVVASVVLVIVVAFSITPETRQSLKGPQLLRYR